MSTAIWGESETQSDESYPLSLLNSLLQQMMEQFMAHGACLALYDENIRQMVIRRHMRAKINSPAPNSPTPAPTNIENIDTIPMNRRKAPGVANAVTSTTGRMRRLSRPLPSLEPVSTARTALFPLGEAYTYRQDLIGTAWQKNELIMLSHDEYVETFAPGGIVTSPDEGTPAFFLAIPIPEPLMLSDPVTRKQQQILGVIVLYQAHPSTGFQSSQGHEAWQWAERFGLYLQNDRLRRLNARHNDYMKRLQQISTAFPSDVILSKLVENVYQFVKAVVHVNSMLLTFYDRDTKKIYDVFAIDHGNRIEGLYEHPVIALPKDRPVWWKVTQEQQRTVLLSLTQDEPELISEHEELLKGAWGDQTNEESFLLLPMKMFNRVVGSLSLTSSHPEAFSPEDILVLETMVQLITVSIENAKLYDRSRRSVKRARQREETLAVMNSALQAISSVL